MGVQRKQKTLRMEACLPQRAQQRQGIEQCLAEGFGQPGTLISEGAIIGCA